MAFLLILTEAFEKLNYLTLFLRLCYNNNIILSDEGEEDLLRKLVRVV